MNSLHQNLLNLWLGKIGFFKGRFSETAISFSNKKEKLFFQQYCDLVSTTRSYSNPLALYFAKQNDAMTLPYRSKSDLTILLDSYKIPSIEYKDIIKTQEIDTHTEKSPYEESQILGKGNEDNI